MVNTPQDLETWGAMQRRKPHLAENSVPVVNVRGDGDADVTPEQVLEGEVPVWCSATRDDSSFVYSLGV